MFVISSQTPRRARLLNHASLPAVRSCSSMRGRRRVAPRRARLLNHARPVVPRRAQPCRSPSCSTTRGRRSTPLLLKGVAASLPVVRACSTMRGLSSPVVPSCSTMRGRRSTPCAPAQTCAGVAVSLPVVRACATMRGLSSPVVRSCSTMPLPVVLNHVAVLKGSRHPVRSTAAESLGSEAGAVRRSHVASGCAWARIGGGGAGGGVAARRRARAREPRCPRVRRARPQARSGGLPRAHE